MTDVIKLDSQHQLDQEIKQLLTTFAEKETEHTWQQFDDAFRRLSAIARGGAAEKFEAFMILIKVKLKQSIVNSLSTERTRLSGTAVEFIEELSRQTGPDFQPLVDIYFPVILKLCARTNKVYITRAQHCLQTIITQSRTAFVIPRLVEAVMTSPSKTLRQCAAENIYLCVKELEDRELEPYVENLEESMRCGVLDQSSAVRECFKKICECYTGKFPDRTNAFISTLSDIAKKYFNFTKRSAPSSPALSSAKRAQFRQIKAASSLENSGDGGSDAVVFFNPGPSTHNLSNEFERNYDGFSKGPSIHDVPQGLPTAKSEPMLSSAAQYNGTLTSLNRMTSSSSADDLKQVSSNKHYEKMMGAIGALRSEQTPIPATPSMNHTVKAAATSTHPQGGGGGARRILNTAPARTTHIDNTATRQPASSLGNPLRVRRATEVQKEVPPTPQAAVKQNINQPTRVMRAAGDVQPARPPSKTVIGKEKIQDTKGQQDGAEDKPEDRNGIKTNGNGASARPPSRSSKPESNKDLIPKTVSRPSHHHHEQQHPPERTTARVQEPITAQQIFQNHTDVVTLWLKTARAPEWSVRAKALAVLGDELTSVCTSMAAKEDSDIGESGHRSLITKILDALLDGLADRNNLKIVNTVLSALLSAIGTTAISRPVGSPKPCTDQHRIFVHHLEQLYLRLLVLRETNQWRTNRVVLERIRVIFEAVNGRYSVRERMDALVGVMAEVAVFEKGMMGSANGGGLRGAVLGEVLNALEQQNGDENEDETKNWIKDEKNIRHLLIRLSSVAGTPDPTTRSLVKKLLTVIHSLAPSQTFCDVVGALKSGEKGILKNMLDALVVTGSSTDVASTTPLDLTEHADHAEPMEIDEPVSRGPTPSNETGGKDLEKNDIESIPVHEIESMSIHQNDLPTTRPVTPHYSIEELLDPNNLTSVLCASSRSNNADLQLKEVLSLASEVDNELWVRRASGVVDVALSALEGVLKRSVLNVDNIGDSARLLPCMSLLNTLVVHQLPNLNGKERDIVRALLNERLSGNRTPPTAASQLLHRGVQSTLQTIIKSWSTSFAISTILETIRDQTREDKGGNTLIVGTSTALTILNTILKRPKHGSEIMRVEFAENVLNYAVDALASSSPSVRKSTYDMITVMATRYSCPENRNEFSMALKKALASCPVAIRVVATRMIRQRISLA